MSYLHELADEVRREVPKDVQPDADAGDLFLIYGVLLLAKGESVTAEDVHNAWVAWMAARGEEHESMRPFSTLAGDTQEEDSPFVTAIRRVAKRRGIGAAR